MPQINAVHISKELLDSLFNEFDLWNKIRSGCLKSKIKTSSPSKRWPSAKSMIIMHFTTSGKHIATTHCVKDKTTIYHWDTKDLMLNDVRLCREY